AEFDLGISFEVDLTDESLGLVSDILRHRDALTQDGVAAQRRDRSLGPLCEPCVDLAIRIDQAHRLASPTDELLEHGRAAEAGELREDAGRFLRGRYEARDDAGPAALRGYPRFAAFDHPREADLPQRVRDLILRRNDDAPRNRAV